MAEKLDRSTLRRAGRWLKWKGLRVVQLGGFLLIAVGAYPFLRPFLATIATPPQPVDTFVQSLGVRFVVFGDISVVTLRAIVFIAVGAIVVWVSTSRRFH